MEWFIEHLHELEIADQLSIAMTERWQALATDRQRGQARRWLADNGYAAGSPRS
jgi:hypothetical protein